MGNPWDFFDYFKSISRRPGRNKEKSTQCHKVPKIGRFYPTHTATPRDCNPSPRWDLVTMYYINVAYRV